jgi:magnesium-transporting ATPase (P-type)
MLQPPRKKDQNLSNFELNMDLMFYGTVLGMFSLGSFMLYIHYSVGLGNMPTGCAKKYIPGICDDIYSARAISFISLSLLILVHGFNCRNNRISMIKYETVNKPLLYAIIFGFFSTIPTTFIPGVNLYMFEQLGFNAIWWVVLVGEIILFIMISELYKYFKRRYYSKKVKYDPLAIPLTVLIQ